MKHAIAGILIVLFLSVQSFADAQTAVPYRSSELYRERTIAGVVTAARPSYIHVQYMRGTKKVTSRFYIRPATKINGNIAEGSSVIVIYRLRRRSHKYRISRRNIASQITVIR